MFTSDGKGMESSPGTCTTGHTSNHSAGTLDVGVSGKGEGRGQQWWEIDRKTRTAYDPPQTLSPTSYPRFAKYTISRLFAVETRGSTRSVRVPSGVHKLFAAMRIAGPAGPSKRTDQQATGRADQPRREDLLPPACLPMRGMLISQKGEGRERERGGGMSRQCRVEERGTRLEARVRRATQGPGQVSLDEVAMQSAACAGGR